MDQDGSEINSESQRSGETSPPHLPPFIPTAASCPECFSSRSHTSQSLSSFETMNLFFFFFEATLG